MNIEKAQAKRKEDHLAKRIRLHEKDGSETTLTVKEFLERKIQKEGFIPYTWEEPRIKDMSRMAFFRATNEEQRAHEKRQQEAGLKTCYGIRQPEQSLSYVVSKTEHDYAVALLELDKAA